MAQREHEDRVVFREPFEEVISLVVQPLSESLYGFVLEERYVPNLHAGQYDVKVVPL